MQEGCLMDGYEALESIGSGSFGLIRKVRRKADGKILARKEIDYRKMSTKEKEQLVAEVNILKDLKHPNIVEFLERVIDRENSFIYILMEYCEGGDLAAVIKRHKEKAVLIPEEFVWSIMTQLVLALHECHCGVTLNGGTSQPIPRPILHRDLKPDNVFLDARKNVKLGDFGLSRSLTNPHKAFAQTYVGTPFYMSPELISESIYDAKSDIWSLGCVIFEMCALEPPFLAESQAELSLKIKLGKIQMLPPQYSQELNQVVRAMLQVTPRRRPTTTDLLSNPRIKMISMQLELKRRSSELDNVMQALMNKEKQIQEREQATLGREKDLIAIEQRLKEKDTDLISKGESLRNMEARLQDWERRLLKERQQVEDEKRTLNERQAAPTHAGMRVTESSNQPSLVKTSDVSSGHDRSRTLPGPESDANGSKTKPLWSEARNSFISNPSYTSALVSLPQASTGALPLSSAFTSHAGSTKNTESARTGMEHLQPKRLTSRRKTTLSAGRPPSHSSASYRNNFSSVNHHSASDRMSVSLTAVMNPAILTLPTPSISQPPVDVKYGSESAMASAPLVATPGKPFGYRAQGGRESNAGSRVSSGQGLLPGSGGPSNGAGSGSTQGQSIGRGTGSSPVAPHDTMRLRNKSKSASSLVAALSTTSLSGKGSAPFGQNPFLVPEATSLVDKSTLPAATVPASSSQSNTSISGAASYSFTAQPSIFTSVALSGSQQPSCDVDMSDSDLPNSKSAALMPASHSFHLQQRSQAGQTSNLNNHGRQTLFSQLGNSNRSMVKDNSASDLPMLKAGGNQRPEHTRESSSPQRKPLVVTDDPGMEWDNDIPSPFIKRTHTRPLSTHTAASRPMPR